LVPLLGAQHLVNALLVDVAAHIRVVTCRHEAAAANMAQAYGRLTGRPGVAFVTRGPGATHAAIGVHTAFQDSTPMLLFIGQIASIDRDREAFQEVDYRAFFTPLAKWASEITHAARVSEYVARAFSTALNGRPGPVVLALPEDMQLEQASAPRLGKRVAVEAAPDPHTIAQLNTLLQSAKQPFLLLGGQNWTPAAVGDISAFAQNWRLPVGTSFRAKDLFDNRHPCYGGDVGIAPNPALTHYLQGCDLLIVLGARLGEMTTSGYTLPAPPLPQQQLVHIHAGAEELGRVYQPMLALQAAPAQAAAALLALTPPTQPPLWAAQTQALHASYQAWITPLPDNPSAQQQGVNLSRVFHYLDSRLPQEAIMCNGAGNYAGWVHRFYQQKRLGTQLAPTSGAMGYGLPAAIAAKILYPDKMVIAVAGDGCFMMAASELATGVHEQVGIVVLVINNSQYGTIRMHQERSYPGRRSATRLSNPDFAALAHSFGCFGARVTHFDAFAATFDAACTAAAQDNRPALIELVTAPGEIAPGRYIDD
jgi:acetolactate synthase I/II/III large subunit